jgi:hypothetical protein
VFLALVLLWGSAQALVRISPNPLAYFSPLVGGPRKGFEQLERVSVPYRTPNNGNYDWGQYMVELRQWQDLRADKIISLRQETAVSYQEYLRAYGIAYQTVSETDLLNERYKGWLLLSAAERRQIPWLWQRQPDAVINYSVYLYRGKS